MNFAKAIALVAVLAASICHACDVNGLGGDSMGPLVRRVHAGLIILLGVFSLAQLLAALTTWAVSRPFNRRPRVYLSQLVIMNFVTPFFVIPFTMMMPFFKTELVMVVFEVFVVFLEAGIIYRLCRRDPKVPLDSGIRYKRALLASFCGNLTSVVVVLAGMRILREVLDKFF